MKKTVDRLTRLTIIRTKKREDALISSVKEKFENLRLAVGARTHDGIVLWGNRAASLLVGRNEFTLSQPIDLMQVLSGSAREILRFQLECERRNLIQPYLNFISDGKGGYLYVRYHPTVVFPFQKNRPYFSVVYLANPREETEEDYFMFCQTLLECL